jgi:uncharacterized membrane protein
MTTPELSAERPSEGASFPESTRLPESTRVEAFSDGVLAIAITLLVLDLHSDLPRGSFAHDLASQWPGYVAYLAAFLNIAAIWINHHDLYTRIRGVDARLVTLNQVLLLVASLFPFPAAVISASQRDGTHHDQVTATLLYAVVGFLVPLTFIAVYTYLSRNPHLLTDPGQTEYTLASRRRAMFSIVVYPVTAALAFVSTDLSLALFIAVPFFFIAAVFWQERSEQPALS